MFHCIQRIQIQLMNSNILQETDAVLSSTNSRTKLNFLEEEKVRLELIIHEMEQQIHLQRHINQELSKGFKASQPEIVSALLAQNKALEQQYLRVKRENEALASSLLINQQLMNENEMEFASSLRSYEEKIIQLRRSIQFKESFIQNMESKYKFAQERIITPSNNVTLLFFNEIEELKKIITTLSAKNKELEHQKQTILAKSEESVKKIQLLQSLALKSKLTFEELKNYYHADHKNRNSAPKKGTYIPLNEKLHQLSIKKLNEAQTRQCSEYSFYPKDSSLKMMIYKHTIEIDKLKETLNQSISQVKTEQQAKNKLVQSHSEQLTKMQQLLSQRNYYRATTRDLMNIIAYRRYNLRAKSQQQSKEQSIIDRIAPINQEPHKGQQRQLWKSLKLKTKIQKPKLLQVKRKYQGFYRSLSSTIDYRTSIIDRDQEKHQKVQKIASPRSRYSKDNTNQFSLMMQAPFEDNISFISKTSPRKTFSQWKKGGKKQAFFNLTVIEENIL